VCTSHFAARAGLDEFAEITRPRRTSRPAAGRRGSGLVSELCDSLHEPATCLTAVVALAATLPDAAIIELVMLSRLIHTVSYLTKALHLPLEDFAARFFTLWPTHEGPFHEPIRPTALHHHKRAFVWRVEQAPVNPSFYATAFRTRIFVAASDGAAGDCGVSRARAGSSGYGRTTTRTSRGVRHRAADGDLVACSTTTLSRCRLRCHDWGAIVV